MAIDMTAQLTPMLWGLVGLIVIASISVFAACQPQMAARLARRSGGSGPDNDWTIPESEE